jgi:hypothetical protein
MADVRNGVPPAIDQLANTVIWWVPASPGIADTSAPKAATELGAATSFDITYGFTTDGWTADSQQAKTTDERLTLLNVLESLDKVTVSFGNGIKYVDSTAVSSPAVVLKPTGGASSISGFFVVRTGIPYATLAAAAQKVSTYPVTLGPQMRGPINGTGKFTWLQQVTLTSPVVEGTTAA